MNVLIADNELVSCSHLTRLLNNIPRTQVVGEAHDGIEAVVKTARLQPDIVLLDVHMTRLDGLSVARHISKITLPPAIIFVSKSRTYSLDALDLHASGYLLKPVQLKRLKGAVQYIRQTRMISDRTVIANHKEHVYYCRSGSNVYLVDLLQVPYLRASNKYTEIVGSNRCLLSSRSLTYFEKKYDSFLMRARRNVLINKFYVREIGRATNRNYVVTLKESGEKIVISRRNGDYIRKNLK